MPDRFTLRLRVLRFLPPRISQLTVPLRCRMCSLKGYTLRSYSQTASSSVSVTDPRASRSVSPPNS